MTTVSVPRRRRLLLALAVTGLVAGGISSVPAQAATTPVYVALGDSYSSGEGACRPVTVTGCDYVKGSNTAADQCHRSANGYPVRVARTLPHGWRLVDAACSGAGTADVLTSSRYGEPAQLAALTAAGGAGTVRLVTLTLGGNDIDFPEAVGTCVALHDLAGSSCHGKLHWAVTPAALTRRLIAVYAAVHAAAPHARLMVLGYPRVFSPHPTVACDLAPVDSVAFSAAENALNSVIAAAVKAADQRAGAAYATFVDDGRVFAGHELCGTTPAKAWLNGLELASGGARSESFHPNRSGQAVLATHLDSALR